MGSNMVDSRAAGSGVMLRAMHPSMHFHRVAFQLCVAFLFLALASAPGVAQEPKLTAQAVDRAVDKAVAWINSRRGANGHWDADSPTGDQYWAGDTALATLSLLYANQDARQDDMAKALDWLAAQSIVSTYVYGIRAHVLSLVPGEKYRKRLDSDLAWLIDAANPPNSPAPGSYTYRSWKEHGSASTYDNSNSQFGVLGAWMATEAGARNDKLPTYWKAIEQHWLREQNLDGGWGYCKTKNEASTGSMTAAGLSTMYVVLDRVHGRGGHRKADTVLKSINAALDWFGGRFAAENPGAPGAWQYYYLYGVERAGRASGRKYFRDRDWFRTGATWLLARQQEAGNWGALHDTCFALMFLCHGRAPIFCNKLEKGDDWDTYLRDAANITRYGSRSLERLMNWQIVALDNTIEDLMESPVLYLHGTKAWEFDESERAKLEEYVARGGLIFAVAPPGKSEFRTSIERLATDLWPRRRMQRVRSTHPLVNGAVQHALARPPELHEVRSETRTLLLLLASDAAPNWNQYKLKEAESDFQLGLNVYLYATDKVTIASRLQTSEIPLEPREPTRSVKVARMKYDGAWDIESAGWERLKAHLHNVAATRLTVVSGVSFTDPTLKDFPVIHVTGVAPFGLNGEEVAGLRRYLTGGGTLIADAAMGSTEFLETFEATLTDVLKVDPARVPATSPLLSGAESPPLVKLSTIEYRRATRAEGRARETPPLKTYTLSGRPAVVYSPLDISVGLLGTNVYDCRGYDSDGALAIMQNLILYGSLPSAEKARLAAGEKR